MDLTGYRQSATTDPSLVCGVCLVDMAHLTLCLHLVSPWPAPDQRVTHGSTRPVPVSNVCCAARLQLFARAAQTAAWTGGERPCYPHGRRRRGQPGVAAVTTMPTPRFGALLKRYRRAAGLTQEAWAEQAHLSGRGI